MELTASHTLVLLERCSTMEELEQIHGQMLKTGLIQEQKPVSRLLAVCTKRDSSSLNHARTVFDHINRPNTFMWNSMIRGYSSSKEPEEALHMYQQMLCHSVPHNAHTFPFLLKACSKLSALEETQQVHAQIIKLGFGSDIYCMNSLLHVYATSGRMDLACLLFDQISEKDIVSWNSMICGYIKCGYIDMAWKVFKDMPIKNVISWTTLISGFVGTGMNREALNLFREMQIAGVQPDKVTLTGSLSACARFGALDQGRWMHGYILKSNIQVDAIMGCVLIDMYAKCGEMEEALKVFAKVEKKNISVWTAIISGFAVHGEGKEALEWFTKMKDVGMKPNSITFTAILNACSHAGLVKEGKSLFRSINSVYGLSPSIEHFGCMVNLLGRAGLLKEAQELINTTPIKPNAAILGALMNACQIHGDLEQGKRTGKLLIEMDQEDSGRYIRLAGIYAAAGEWNHAVKVRMLMKDRGVRKPPGQSAVSLNGVVHEFVAGDKSHPECKEIYHMWDEIADRLRKEGYKPAIGNVLLDLDEDEKETSVHKHSEKLAVAFALIKTKPGKRIRIIKNLRVCEDCHTVMKLISRIYAREIIMRDRIRFHLFRNGKCTCGDYW